jgi:hypothetical protein
MWVQGRAVGSCLYTVELGVDTLRSIAKQQRDYYDRIRQGRVSIDTGERPRAGSAVAGGVSRHP